MNDELVYHYKKDGTLDMRFKTSKEYIANGGSIKGPKGDSQNTSAISSPTSAHADKLSHTSSPYQSPPSSPKVEPTNNKIICLKNTSDAQVSAHHSGESPSTPKRMSPPHNPVMQASPKRLIPSLVEETPTRMSPFLNEGLSSSPKRMSPPRNTESPSSPKRLSPHQNDGSPSSPKRLIPSLIEESPKRMSPPRNDGSPSTPKRLSPHQNDGSPSTPKRTGSPLIYELPLTPKRMSPPRKYESPSSPKSPKSPEKATVESDYYILRGKVMKDCLAVRKGEVILDAFGMVDKRSAAVKRGTLKILESGYVDPDCEAYKSQEKVSQRRIHTEEIRDRSKQSAFRRANNMVGKDCEASHVVDLEVAVAIVPSLVPPDAKITEVCDKLRPLNDPKLLRNESFEQNRKKNPEIAHKIINLHRGKEEKPSPEVKERLLDMANSLDTLDKIDKNDLILKLQARFIELSKL